MTHDQTTPPLLNAILVLATMSFTAISDFLPDIDFVLSVITRLISIVSFICFLVLNFDNLVLRVKKIFNGK